MTATNPTLRAIRDYCRANAEQHRDRATGEVNFTTLAESCAYAIGYAGWLDEETHPVWDAALDAAEESDRLRHG
jgi:hydroxypyruvate isomerase